VNEVISLEGFNPLLSEAVKNDKAVKNLSQTAVLFANLLVELSTHMEEEAFAPVKEKVLDFLSFADEVFKAITPTVVEEAPIPNESAVEVPKWSPVLGATKEIDPSVQGIFDSLDPKVSSIASSAVGVKHKPQPTVVQDEVREIIRTRFKNAVDKGIINSIRNGATIDQLTNELDLQGCLQLSDYERAIGYVEHWRNT
jgi:hypothetical protein